MTGMKSDTKAGAKTAAKTAAEWLVAAGFGAMYERHGFHRVSATQYRMDRDGLVWRAVVGKGRPNDPNSFRESVGCQIQGLPELLERLDEKKLLLKLPGTRIDVDWYTDSVYEAKKEEMKPYNEALEQVPKTFWRWLFSKIPEPPITLDRRHPDIDHMFRGDGYLWDAPKDRPFQDFADELVALWEAYVWPKLEGVLDLPDFLGFCTEDHISNQLNVLTIARQYLIGNHGFVRGQLAHLMKPEQYDPEAYEKELTRRGVLSKDSLEQRRVSKETLIKNGLMSRLEFAERAQHILEILYRI